MNLQLIELLMKCNWINSKMHLSMHCAGAMPHSVRYFNGLHCNAEPLSALNLAPSGVFSLVIHLATCSEVMAPAFFPDGHFLFQFSEVCTLICLAKLFSNMLSPPSLPPPRPPPKPLGEAEGVLGVLIALHCLCFLFKLACWEG